MTTTPLPVRRFEALQHLAHLPRTTTDAMLATYRSYVQKPNEILHKLSHSDFSSSHPVYSEFRSRKREFPHALGAVKSFEIFFAHLTAEPAPGPDPLVLEQIRRDFGSWERFRAELRATAQASRGWVAVGYDLDLRMMLVQMGDTPEDLTVWNTAPILIIDVSDRAAAIDFKGDRAKYFDAVMRHIDWSVVSRNLEDALELQPAGRMM